MWACIQLDDPGHLSLDRARAKGRGAVIMLHCTIESMKTAQIASLSFVVLNLKFRLDDKKISYFRTSSFVLTKNTYKVPTESQVASLSRYYLKRGYWGFFCLFVFLLFLFFRFDTVSLVLL